MMDLEVAGRHALLFDDDTMAAFVNSKEALVEWNSLLIDRYDVRHLLSSPPPPRSKRRHADLDDDDSVLGPQLDEERYLDLPPEAPSPSLSDQQGLDGGAEPTNIGAYHAVGFSYGNISESTDQKDAGSGMRFHPSFPVPEGLLQNLPPTEKVHQIIARTAMFVRKHGGQSEIILRVKQGDNPTFGFLMPDHPLHPYFRFLVDHQEVLAGKSPEEDYKAEGELGHVVNVGGGGALSLLGSVYGTGEDEDTKTEGPVDLKSNASIEAGDAVRQADSSGSEGAEVSKYSRAKDEIVLKHPHLSSKDKASIVKRNPSLGSKTKKECDRSVTPLIPTDKSKSSVSLAAPQIEMPVIEPSIELKRVIDKIVEFILRNGKEFESVLAEQDVKHGRFPFLLPTNLYHPYYRKVLQKAEKSKLSGKGSTSEKHEKKGTAPGKSDTLSIGSDIPDDIGKKEKFKMVIGKLKKDGPDQSPVKPAQSEVGISVDAAAAILQAARRGIKNPDLLMLSGNESAQILSNGSYSSSQAQSSINTNDQTCKCVISMPLANSIGKTAAIAAASEADSLEAGLSREQKLKAERLKRAKMFVAMLKTGGAPLKTEPSRSLSVEPTDSGVSGSGATTDADPTVKEREGSSVPFDGGVESEKRKAGDGHSKRWAKRKYRSRLERENNEDEDKDEEEEEEEEEEKEKEKEKGVTEEERDHKRSKRRHSHHHPEHHSRGKHKHKKRHSSSKDIDSRDRHMHNSSSDDEHHRSRHRHRHSKSSGKHKHDDDGSSDAEHHDDSRSRKHKHDDAFSDDEHHHRHRSRKHRKRSRSKRETEVEDEIGSKLSKGREASVDLSRSSAGERASSQPSDTGEVPEDLRAKVRAMLMATL